MSDLISRHDSISYIDRVMNSGLGKNKSLEYIRKYLENMPSAQQWIPCSERLPETGTNVLLYIPPRDGVNQQGIRIGYRDERNPIPEDEKGERNFWGIRTYGGEWNVTGWGYYDRPIPAAWMPLPEPWKGESNVDNT